MAYETILVESRGPVGVITLNRPKAMNALNARLVAELSQALATFDGDPDTAAIVSLQDLVDSPALRERLEELVRFLRTGPQEISGHPIS